MKKPHQRTVKIGLLGFGTVGQGVWKHIERNRRALELRLGASLEIVRIAVRDAGRKREVEVPSEIMTTDTIAVAEDPSLDIVCELMGGTEEALDLTERVLKRGKIVVTANKALICEHGDRLFNLARQAGGHYFYEASVAGGIPVIKTLREALVANRFSRIYGILNGTSNYILTRMEKEGLEFATTLADARALGYVEADEALDLDGIDAAHKAVILAYLAHGRWVSLNDMIVEGIRDVTAEDILSARNLGYRIKLLAIISRDFQSERLVVRVHPALLPTNGIIAGVDGVYNGVSITGDVVGTTVLIGRGAGQDATSSSVISDIADAVFMLQGAPAPVISEEDDSVYRELAEGLSLGGPEDIKAQYYLRLHVADKPGVLAKVAGVLADFAVSIATVDQRAHSLEGTASLILTTHETDEKAMDQALGALAAMSDLLQDKPVRFRVFDPEEG
jgi:homoserine dehydrogenase